MKYSEIKLYGWYYWKYKKDSFIGKVIYKPEETTVLRSVAGDILMSVTSIKDFRSWNLADVDCVRPVTKKQVKAALTKVKL